MDDILLYICMLILAVMLVALPICAYKDAVYGAKFKEACKAQHGYVYKPYRSPRICLASSQIIPLEIE